MSLSCTAKGIGLRPVSPSSNRRYQFAGGTGTSCGFSTLPLENIPSASRFKTLSEGKAPLPNEWDELQHPEGDRYFFWREKYLVTPADVRDRTLHCIIGLAYASIISKLSPPNAQGYEIYLNPIYENESWVAEYYFVEHVNRMIFWIEPVAVGDIGLPPYTTKGFIKSALTPEYWTHVDYFPIHRGASKEATNELIGILIHGRVDGMTSPGTTCPYSEEECAKYIDCIEKIRDLPDAAGYRTGCVARIWCAISRARHINDYGLNAPRLDRLQGALEFRQLMSRPSFKLAVIETLCFFNSIPLLDRLMLLFNGRVVYQRHWNVFFNDMRRIWLAMGILSLFSLLMDVLLLIGGVANALTAASASFASSTVFISIYLHQMHPDYLLATGPDISAYVMKHEDFYQGLRPLSIMLALPQSLTIYSSICLLCAVAQLIVERTEIARDTYAVIIALFIGALPVLTTASFFSKTGKYFGLSL